MWGVLLLAPLHGPYLQDVIGKNQRQSLVQEAESCAWRISVLNKWVDLRVPREVAFSVFHLLPCCIPCLQGQASWQEEFELLKLQIPRRVARISIAFRCQR